MDKTLSIIYYSAINLVMVITLDKHFKFLGFDLVKYSLYLTDQCFILTFIYSIIRLLESASVISQWRQRNWYLRFIFNLNLQVTVMFWGLRLFFRDLLMANPKLVIPFDLEVLEHGFGLAFLALELKGKYTSESIFKAVVAFTVYYLSLLKLAYYLGGVTLYGFVSADILTFVAVVLSSIIVCLSGDLVYQLIFKHLAKF